MTAIDQRIAELRDEFNRLRDSTDDENAVYELARALAEEERRYEALKARVVALVEVDTPMRFWLSVGGEVRRRAAAGETR